MNTIYSGAEFSECNKYRYSLWRRWEPAAKQVMFIGLNPSTADETNDDPTIRRCVNFSRLWGFGGIMMVNAYAFRATDPKEMLRCLSPVGSLNDEHLKTCSDISSMVVAAWGVHCTNTRAARIFGVLNRTIHCLGQTKDGFPKHPLYLKSTTQTQVLWEPTQ